VKLLGIAAVLTAACVLAGFGGTAGVTGTAYTLAGTRSCLIALPHAISGLPPAGPIGRPAVFVYRLSGRSQDSFVLGGTRRPHTQLGAWTGAKYAGIIFNFFPSDSAARLSYKSVTQLYGGTRIRNVVATWDGSKPNRRIRRTLLGCLRSKSASPSGVIPRPVPAASLATLAGGWGGHTRGLGISKSGTGRERASDGCCDRLYDLSFQITSVSGTLIRATATYSVTAFTNYASGDGVTIKVGDVGKLQLRNGMLTNTLTHDIFCGDVAWGASRTGGCGA
jgi:hypothetical protein